MKVIIIKFNVDSKGGDRFVFRFGVDRKVDLLILEDDNIFDIIKVYLNENRKIDCILVDEV